MRAPVSVSVRDTQGQWRRLDGLTGVTYGTVAPGGMADATIPVGDTADLPELQQGCLARIASGETGRTVWTGRVSSPVRQVRGILQTGSPSFEGQSGFLADQTTRYTPLATGLDSWWEGTGLRAERAKATVSQGQVPVAGSASDALMFGLPSGQIVSGDCALASFHGFFGDYSTAHGDAQNIRAFIGRHREGAKAANQSKFRSFIMHGSTAYAWQSAAVSPSAPMSLLLDPTVTGETVIGFEYTGAAVNTTADGAAVVDDELWAGWWQLQVFRQIVGVDGSPVTGWNPIPTGGLRPHEIVADLIGTLPGLGVDTSPASTVIDTTSDAVLTSFAFTGRVTAADVLSDLNSLVPTHFWWVGTADVNGRMGVSWTPWSATRTLLLPPGAVTYGEQAGSVDLANQVWYSYTDDGGRVAQDFVMADPWTYPDVLTLGDRTVEADPLDLTALGSATAARAVATAYLGEVARTPKAATATVSTPVADQDGGYMIPPWELTAGCMAHVPETGETLRVTAVSVDVDTATATLTLGTPRRMTDQIVATMSRRRQRRS